MLLDQGNEDELDPTIYPTSDNMGESGLQKWVCDLMIGLLRSYFFAREERPMLVGGNQFIYLRKRDNELRIAPDIYVIEDETLPIENVKSWKVWEHEGKVPSLAIEVVSDEYDKDYGPDMIPHYQELGVRELLRYDPEFYLHPRALKYGPRRLLTHYVRDHAGLLQEVPLASKRSAKSVLYDFWFIHQPSRSLRLGVGPQGRKLWPTDAERAQAESERAQAESERARLAEAEVEQLRAELAALRAQQPR